jgi:hypothetical protein
MNTCPNEQTLERWFDGELDDATVANHAESCPVCRDYVNFLQATRRIAKADSAARIEDTQMPTYLEGLRAGVQRRRTWGRVWAAVSVAAAALIVALSLSSIFSHGPAPVLAHSVIEAHSDITGATTDTFEKDGTTTVWVHLPEDDMQ